MAIARVMICDDDVLSSSMLEEILLEIVEGEIFKLSRKSSIIPKLKELKKEKKALDYIFLNAKMKKEHTLDIIKKMGKVDKHTQIILCGGRDLTDEILKRSLKYNVKHILGKPYEQDEVLSLIERCEEERA